MMWGRIWLVSLLFAVTCSGALGGRYCIQRKLISNLQRPDFYAAFPEDKVVRVKLLQHFKGRCVEGVTYGFIPTQAFAERGCQGFFEICFERKDITTTGGPLPPQPLGCRVIKLIGRKNSVDKLRVDNGQEITSLTLLKLFSGVCIKDVTYGFSAKRAFAKNNCKARFEICIATTTTTTTTIEPTTVTTVPATTRAPGTTSFVTNTQPPQPTTAPNTTPVPVTAGSTVKLHCDTVKLLGRKNRDDKIEVGAEHQIVSLTLIKVFFGTCIKDVNYGFTSSVAYAKEGCKARFQICVTSTVTTEIPTSTTMMSAAITSTPAVQASTAEPHCHTIKLIGRKNKMDKVSVGSSHRIISMTLTKLFTRSVCLFGANFGYTESEAYAKLGCRARFEICVVPIPTTTTTTTTVPTTATTITTPTITTVEPAPVTGVSTISPVGVKCIKVVLISPRNFFKLERIVDSKGDDAEIQLVTIKKQLTQVECIRKKNFFVKGSLLVVKRGCGAKFKVCFKDDSVLATQSPKPIPGRTTPPITVVPPGADKCKIVVARGPKSGLQMKEVRYKGQLVEIVSVVVLVELPPKMCTPDKFFYSGSDLFVKDQCKAKFAVCFKLLTFSTLPAVPSTTTLTTLPTTVTTQAAVTTTPRKKKCFYTSLISKNGRKDLEFSHLGKISSLTLVIEFSNNKCNTNTYGFQANLAYAKNGCQGRFIICSE